MFSESTLQSAIRSENGISRRLFQAYLGQLSLIPALALSSGSGTNRPRLADDPFRLGVASGDPDATSVVLWTKLAPDPNDPSGGMKPEPVSVLWEIADSDSMQNIVATGTALASPQLGHSVHVEVQGLKPNRWYWYRFKVGDATSPVGQTRTLPTQDELPDQLRFAFASCQHYEQGLYTAYQGMAKDNLDLVFHLGDYIYEYPGKDKLVRKHSGPAKGKIKTLADYRLRHMQYRADALLHGMHARCPWIVTWDDHEFDNNYANDIQEITRNGPPRVSPAEFLVQRAAAYQAYYEMMPLRSRSIPQGPNMQLYRKASFGKLADFFVLDTRQYRTDQPNNDGLKPLNENALNPNNSLLGKPQRSWLDSSLVASTSKWNVLAQQVMMGMVEIATQRTTGFSMDQWPGAATERMNLMSFLAQRRIANPIVLTGDIHSNWVNNLRVDDRKGEQPIVATEFVGTSISSGGNGAREVQQLADLKSRNPCVQYHNRQRGYVRCTVTPKNWRSDYVVVEDVLKPDGRIAVHQSFVVESGVPGAKPA